MVKRIVEQENAEYEDDFSCVRRVALSQRKEENCHNVCRELKKEERCVPPHLQDLYKRSCEGKSPEERNKIQSLLIEYQEVFSKRENDLGRVSITGHTTDTRLADSIKQAPRRVPLA